MNDSRVIWTGNSTLNNKPIAVIAKAGGNGKVSGGRRQVMVLSVVPMATIEAIMRRGNMNKTPIQLARVYLDSMKSGDIDAVCHDDCEHKRTRKCYAQFNAQSVTEPIAMIRAALSSAPGVLDKRHMHRTRKGETVPRARLDRMLRDHRFQAGDRFRLMAVGSTGALPVDVAAWLVETFTARGMTALAYVENWRSRPDLRTSHMASCYSLDDVADATAQGWTPFFSPAAEDAGNTLPDGMVLCPASKMRANIGRKRTSCASCGLCSGSRDDGKARPGIVSIRHGNGDDTRMRSLVRKGMLGALIRNGKGKTVGAYRPMFARVDA
jgi:hypothetical protein